MFMRLRSLFVRLGFSILGCGLLSATSAVATEDFSWLHEVEASAFDTRARGVDKLDRETGAMWTWDAGKKAGGVPSFTVHPPWKGVKGIVFADFPVTLPSARELNLKAAVALARVGGDGVGVSVLVVERGDLHFLHRLEVSPDAEPHALEADLSRWAGRAVTLRLLLDSRRTTHADTTRIANLRIVSASDVQLVGTEALAGVFKAAQMSQADFNDLLLHRRRSTDDAMMNRHLEGRRPVANVYSRQDSYRPMFGAHVYLTPEARRFVPHLGDLFDFAAHGGGAKGNSLMEENGVPWVQVIQNAIPLGAWDTKRQDRLSASGRQLLDYGDRYRFCLGVTSGSEPHINPNFSYTGHTKEEVDGLPGGSPEASRDFGAWLAGLYGDKSPSEDSNRDGITFRSDFGFSAGSWDELGLNLPTSGGEEIDFLKTLYRERVISNTIATVDRVFNESGLAVSSRLLSRQYAPAFAQSVRQLRLPTGSTGVTYYNYRGMSLDPEATQARFSRERVYQSEKTYKSVLSIRPPFRGAAGASIGVFGPYRGHDRFEAELKAGFEGEKASLLVTVEQVDANDPLKGRVLRKKTFTVAAGATMPAVLDLSRSSGDWYLRIICRADGRGSASTSVYVDPWLLTGRDRRHDVCGDYFDGALWAVLDENPREAIDMGYSKINYNPGVTEFRGSYIYQQARLRGQRPVYNEFQTGNADGNTAANLYRGVFHELQFKPAVINWFCYGGGSPYARFAWMDIHYMATELATLRGQLEVMRPYEQIERQKRPLAVFIPPAGPAPVDIARKDMRLAEQLAVFGPDVFLNDQTDKYADYDNIIIALAYADGATDRFLSDFLQNIPPGKRVLALCLSSQLYAGPGMRSSADFRRSLREVLPVSPDGGAIPRETVSLGNTLSLDMDLPANVLKNPRFTNGQWLRSGNRTVGWRGGNLMVLAGNPVDGLEAVVGDFFGLTPTALREAGKLKILNRDTTATEAGWYCLDEGQTLTIGDRLVGYDLVKRKPVGARVVGETVVAIFPGDAFEILDAGTAPVEFVSKDQGRIVVRARPPRYPFEGDVRPELVIYHGRRKPVALRDGVPVDLHALESRGFYALPVTQEGDYQFLTERIIPDSLNDQGT